MSVALYLVRAQNVTFAYALRLLVGGFIWGCGIQFDGAVFTDIRQISEIRKDYFLNWSKKGALFNFIKCLLVIFCMRYEQRQAAILHNKEGLRGWNNIRVSKQRGNVAKWIWQRQRRVKLNNRVSRSKILSFHATCELLGDQLGVRKYHNLYCVCSLVRLSVNKAT